MYKHKRSFYSFGVVCSVAFALGSHDNNARPWFLQLQRGVVQNRLVFGFDGANMCDAWHNEKAAFVNAHKFCRCSAQFALELFLWRASRWDDVPDCGLTSPASFANGWGFVASTAGKTVFAASKTPMWFTKHA